MDQASKKDYLKELNEIQRKAVTTTQGPVLVVAGPGSGKTRVLTYRIAHLIETGVKPWEILTLTFTNKAAREMKERIERVVGPKAKDVWAGTFHSIFARILRIEAEKIGYSPNFTIYDTDDTKSLLKAIVKGMNYDTEVYKVNGLRSRISSAKSNLITPKLYERDQELRFQDKMAKRPFTYAIYQEYVARCKRSGAMDFDDLMFRFYELLQKNQDGVLDKYRQRFPYVLVDEFQDTNHLQYEIVKKLVHYDKSPRNICVVGDDAQSIYAFRGATIQNMLDFEKDFKTFGIQVFKLEQNYRSTKHIVETANQLITHNRNQIQKKIWSSRGEGQKVKVIKAMTDTEEGKRVADTIVEHKNRFHVANREIAVLYRTNAQSRIFEEYLRRYNVHYRVFGGMSFYQRKEVKDLIAYLRLAINQKDEEALRRVLNYPKRGIGASSFKKITDLASSTGKSLWECLPLVPFAKRTGNAVASFVQLIKRAIHKAETDNAYDVANFVARESGLIDLLKKDHSIEGITRLENIDALLDGIKSFVEEDVVELGAEDDRSLATYLQNIALLTDFDTENKDEDYVTLMSVHSAKGLEFKSVFVVGLEEQLFPSFLSMDDPDGLDEERRLFYVAITRAEQLLTLSYANSRYRYGQMRFNEPSRFLQECPSENLESTAAFTVTRTVEAQPQRSKVTGNFTRKKSSPAKGLMIDPANFKASPSEKIQAGMKVLHLKFGEGKVLSVDGGAGSRIATIFFKDIEQSEKRIMLKFAKLQILG